MPGRNWIATLVVGVFLAAPGVASAAQEWPPTQDSVHLTSAPALVESPLTRLDISTLDAESGPSGENPAGSARIRVSLPPPCFPPFRCALGELVGSVTCLSVDGNAATVTFRDEGPFAGRLFSFRVVDANPDAFVFMSSDACSPSAAAGGPLVYGDIEVVDAVPPPTARGRCKSGGWERFGFANQGRCVRFVEQPALDADL